MKDPDATLAPEGRWYRRWRANEDFLTWATPEQFQAHQDALRAAHQNQTVAPLPPRVEENT